MSAAIAKPVACSVAYQAEWIEEATYLAAARNAGWDGETDSALDFLPPEHFETEKRSFKTLKGAERHLQFITANSRALFGAGTVYEVETVPRAERCRYCTCRGARVVREHTVESGGIVESHGRDDCWGDE